jgi:hypothetical protein
VAAVVRAVHSYLDARPGADECPNALPGHDEAFASQDGERTADGRPARVVRSEQLALGWHAVARRSLAAEDLLPQVAQDAPVWRGLLRAIRDGGLTRRGSGFLLDMLEDIGVCFLLPLSATYEGLGSGKCL